MRYISKLRKVKQRMVVKIIAVSYQGTRREHLVATMENFPIARQLMRQLDITKSDENTVRWDVMAGSLLENYAWGQEEFNNLVSKLNLPESLVDSGIQYFVFRRHPDEPTIETPRGEYYPTDDISLTIEDNDWGSVLSEANSHSESDDSSVVINISGQLLLNQMEAGKHLVLDEESFSVAYPISKENWGKYGVLVGSGDPTDANVHTVHEVGSFNIETWSDLVRFVTESSYTAVYLFTKNTVFVYDTTEYRSSETVEVTGETKDEEAHNFLVEEKAATIAYNPLVGSLENGRIYLGKVFFLPPESRFDDTTPSFYEGAFYVHDNRLWYTGDPAGPVAMFNMEDMYQMSISDEPWFRGRIVSNRDYYYYKIESLIKVENINTK